MSEETELSVKKIFVASLFVIPFYFSAGLFDKRLCPRGKTCNFLHVFRNPKNAFSVPNRTDFDPERAFRSGGYDPRFVNPKHPVFQYYSQRDAYGYRSSDIKKKSSGYGYVILYKFLNILLQVNIIKVAKLSSSLQVASKIKRNPRESQNLLVVVPIFLTTISICKL